MTLGSLPARITAWFAGIVLVVLSASSIASYLHVRQALLEVVDRGLETRARTLGRLVLADPAGAPAPADLGRQQVWSRARPFRAFLIRDASTGAEIAASESLGGAPAARSAIAGAAIPEGRRAVGATIETADAGRFRVVQVRREVGGRVYTVAVAEDKSEVTEELNLIAWGFGAALVLALGTAVGCGWLAARRITAPLDELARFAERSEDGAAVPGLQLRGPDEVVRLGRTLDRTFARLQAALDRQRRFTSDASHELRTPLAAILTEADLALRRPRTVEEHRQAHEQIAASARRMHATVESLLLLARLDADAAGSRPASVDAAAALRAAADAVSRRAAERGATLEIVDGAPTFVHGDADLLAIAFRNVLGNAVEHGRDGGRVEARIAADGDGPVVTVRDDGPGIPVEALPRVLEPFFRADPARSRGPGGAGLGLSIAHRIVTLHGGTIAVTSEPGKGTLVTIRLRGASAD